MAREIRIELKNFIDLFKLEISKGIMLSGHDHYMSPYETCDGCGNCSGAKCDWCHEVPDIRIWKKELDYNSFIKILRGSQIPDTPIIPNKEWLEECHKDLLEFLAYPYDEESDDAKEEFEKVFLGTKFVFVDFHEYDLPDDMLETVWCLTMLGKDKGNNLWFHTKDEAEIVQKKIGTGWIFDDVKGNLDGSEIFLSVEESS